MLYKIFFQVTVLLKDVNDRTPIFQFQDYQSEVSEDSPVGSTVTTVQATDMDSAENTVVIFLLSFKLFVVFASLDTQITTWTVKVLINS